jgi:O-antigen ligase
LKIETSFFSLSLTSAKNVACIFVLCWICAVIFDHKRFFVRSGLEKPILAFFAVVVFSACFSSYGPAGDRWRAVTELAVYATYFYAALYVIGARTAGYRVAALLFGCAVIVALINVVYHFKVGTWVIIDQAFPLWDGKNAQGLYMVLALSTGYALFSSSRGTSRALSVFLVIGLFVIFLALVYSYSRGAWIALIAMVIACGFMRVWRVIVVALIALTILMILPHRKVFHRFRSIPHMGDGNVAKRFSVWRGSLRMLEKHPVFGVGPGQFREAFGQMDASHDRISGGERNKQTMRFADHAHNVFFQVAAETGLAGFAVFLWLCGAIVSRGARRLKDDADKRGQSLAVTAFAALAAFTTFSMVDCSWTGRFSGSSFLHINLIMALFVAMLCERRPPGRLNTDAG